jgi:hypothetical protein
LAKPTQFLLEVLYHQRAILREINRWALSLATTFSLSSMRILCSGLANMNSYVVRDLAALMLFLFLSIFNLPLQASEGPYFVTYDHHMEEPGSLEIGITPTIGMPTEANGFLKGKHAGMVAPA